MQLPSSYTHSVGPKSIERLDIAIGLCRGHAGGPFVIHDPHHYCIHFHRPPDYVALICLLVA